MIKIVAIAIQVIAVAGGAYVGVVLSSGSSGKAEQAEHDSAAEDSHAPEHAEKPEKEKKKDEHKDKKAKKKGDKHGGGHGAETSGESGFMKFSRQFVVPVVSRNNVTALVIMDLNLELDPSSTESDYAREPKVRDAILKSLLQLSNEGAFGEDILDEENLDQIRERLRASAQTVLGDDVIDVLILNVARQDA